MTPLFYPIVQPLQLAILARLADPINGFDANFAAATSGLGYNLPPEATAAPINWTISGPNVALGRIASQDSLVDSSNFQYPYVLIDIVSGQAGRRSVFERYSGPMKATVQFILSWEADQIVDFASWQNATIDAMYAVFNAPANGVTWYPGPGVTWAAQMDFSKTPVREGGSGWIAMVEFGMLFEVTVQ